MVTSTEASGPAAITRSMRSDSSTLRPAESRTSRASAGIADNVTSATAMAARRNQRAAEPSAGLCRPNELSDRAELPACRAARVSFDGAIETDHLFADRSDHGAAALAAARLRCHRRLARRIIDLFDQQPRAAIRHAERPCRRRDRAGGPDCLQERNLAGPDAVAAGEVDADGQACGGHDVGPRKTFAGSSRLSPWG